MKFGKKRFRFRTVRIKRIKRGTPVYIFLLSMTNENNSTLLNCMSIRPFSEIIIMSIAFVGCIKPFNKIVRGLTILKVLPSSNGRFHSQKKKIVNKPYLS